MNAREMLRVVRHRTLVLARLGAVDYVVLPGDRGTGTGINGTKLIK